MFNKKHIKSTYCLPFKGLVDISKVDPNHLVSGTRKVLKPKHQRCTIPNSPTCQTSALATVAVMDNGWAHKGIHKQIFKYFN